MRKLAENMDLPICFLPEPAADCDALVPTTDWPAYRDLPWEDLRRLVRHPYMADAQTAGPARNWNTLTGLRELAERLAMRGIGTSCEK